MINADEVYNIICNGSSEERQYLMVQLPKNSMKDTAEGLLHSGNPVTVLMAFGSLLLSYVHGADCATGEVLGKALYRYGKELFLTGEYPDLYLMTVLGFAHSYVTALNNLSKFEIALEFVEDELPLWEEYEEHQDKLNPHERASFSDNMKSILVAKIGILVNLGRLDDADLLAENRSRVEGNWSSDIELKRLIRIIKDRKTSVSDLARDDSTIITESKERQGESNKSILDSLKIMMDQSGLDSELIDNLSKSSEIDPNTQSGYDNLEDILTQGESFLQKGGGTETNEISIRQTIRRASGIFVDNQPSGKQILDSLDKLTNALKLAKDVRNNVLINDAYYGLYLCYSRLHSSSEAADQLINLRKNLELTRKGIADPLERGGVFSTYPYLFYSSVEHLYKANREDDMLDAIEGSKGRTIIDSLEKESLRNYSDFELYNIRERLHPLLLRENAHYISYHVDDDDIYISLVTKSGVISSHQVPFGKNLLERWFLKNLHNPASWNDQFIKTYIIKELGPLVSFLKPFIEEGVIEENDHICYSADHLLYLFPLHFLKIGSKSLIDLFTVSRIHNAGHLISLLSKPLKRPDRCLTVEVPSQTDLKKPEIVSDFSVSANLLEQKFGLGHQHLHHSEASRDAVLSKCQKNQLIHFATHGFFPKSDNPFSNSGLLIAYNGKLPHLYLNDPDYKYVDEGEHLLSPERILNEVYNFVDIDQSHISLQACVAGYAREGIAGDALGIEWAFMQRGASSMTSTFWNIALTNANDFYKSFYEEWIDKRSSRAEAHRKSILKLKNSKHSSNLPSEFYWAGYGLIGDWR